MKPKEGSWAEIADKPCYHFDVAEKFNLSATFNAKGSRSMAHVIRRMAQIIDDEIKRRADAGLLSKLNQDLMDNSQYKEEG